MRRTIFSVLLTVAAAGAPALSGCAETVREEKTTRTRPDGTVTTDRETVKRMPDGSVVHEREKDVDRRGVGREVDLDD